MLTRCSATNGKDHENYAARGISVDNRWLIFENFLEDMGDPGEGESIERKDNNLGYSKENCRWATCLEQNRNKRNTTFITVGGVTLPLTEWSDLTGINMHTLHARLKKGWSHVDVLHTPIRGTRG